MKTKKILRPTPKKPRGKEAAFTHEAQFAAFIMTRQILIADGSTQTRIGLSKLLRSLGARAENIFLAANYEAAVGAIHSRRPELIICDYRLGAENGLKLIHHQKRQFLDDNANLFILVTAEAGEAAIAEAAEEEIDSYILKPFTITGFKEHLIGAALAKLNPDPYRQCLQQAKLRLAEGQAKPAAVLLEGALKLSPTPSLAHYYLAQALLLENHFEKAEASFRKGLSYNPAHYRCLTGLFDLLIERKMRKEAYAVGQQLINAFPLTPSRLEDLITLAMQNELFRDTSRFFQLHQEMDSRTPSLTQCMSAALLVSAKHFLEDQKKEAAILFFENAITAAARSGRSHEMLEKTILTLLEYGELGLADRFLGHFPLDHRHRPEFLRAEFMILNESASLDKILTQGRNLLKKGVHDPAIYEILVKRALQAKLKRAAETMAYEAATLWPDNKARFLKLIEEI